MQDEKEVASASDAAEGLDAAQVREFYRLATSYWAAGALIAAVRLRLFDALDNPGAGDQKLASPAEVANGLNINPNWAAKLMEACAALGLLDKHGNRFANSPLAAALLVTRSPFYQGDLILHLGEQWFRFGELDFTVRTGRQGPLAAAQQDGRTDEEQRESGLVWVRGMHDIAVAGQAAALAAALDLSGRQRLLDVGCGPGTYSVELCRHNPQLQATAFDLPEIIAVTQEFIDQSGVADRVSTQAGSFLHDNYGRGYDVVLLSGILHGIDAAGCRKVLRRAYHALDGGGMIAVQEALLGEDRAGPLFPALFSLNMMRGASYRGSEIEAWLAEAGFAHVELRPLPNAPWLDTVITAAKD